VLGGGPPAGTAFESFTAPDSPQALTLPSGSIRCVDIAFYEPAGHDTYVATAATVGPWSHDAQHGGPPSALAARALERHEPDERQRLARVAVDILRPIPVGKLSVRTRMVRPGRRIALAEAVMEADGQEVLYARGWRIERPGGEVPEIVDGASARGLPATGDGEAPPIFTGEPDGYLASIEWRFLRQEHQGGADDSKSDIPTALPVPGTPEGQDKHARYAQVRAAWARPLIPLLPDEEPSAMSRALLVADSGSGVGAALPATEFVFVNVDVTVVLPRDPVGEWLLLEATTAVGSDGTGLAMTRLSDRTRPCGRAWQTLLIAPR
jgi:Acyl-CoA thioesterase N-terminal domain/Acyl-CoA thioesterase C-terminal domain